jgi:hypothetical protein
MEFSNLRMAIVCLQGLENWKWKWLSKNFYNYEKDKTRNVTGGLLALLLAAGVFWSRYRYIKKTNAQLKIARDQTVQSNLQTAISLNMRSWNSNICMQFPGMSEILKGTTLPAQKLSKCSTYQFRLQLVILNDVLDISK